MKKTKLLLATPLMLAPVLTTLPVITACSKKSDVKLSSDFAKYVDVEVVTEKLVKDQPYVAILSIKQDQIGKQFLPNSLKTVKSGDVELWQRAENNTNGWLDYYRYIPMENNTKAYLYINNVSGTISVEAETSELDHVTATPIEVTGTEQVEFEVGETANTAGRILATATLKNKDIILLTDYTINLTDYKSDYKFTTEDIAKTASGKKGTITFNGKTSKEFKFIVRAVTQAYLTAEWTLTSSIKKYASIPEAVAAYETYRTAGTAGDYTIGIMPGKYDISSPITLNEANDINLSIEPAYWLGESILDEYPIEFTRTGVTADNDSLIKIVGATDTTGSVSITGIQFNQPKTTLTNKNYSHILLDDSNNINIAVCDFEGNAAHNNNIYAIKTDTGKSTSYLSIYICEGQYLESLYTGTIGHTTGTKPDLSITYSGIKDSRQLFNITGTAIEAYIAYSGAGIMWNPSATATNEISGMSISGTGKYEFEYCSFEQIYTATSTNGFVKILSTATDTPKELVFNECELTTKEKVIPGEIHDVYNASGLTNGDWSISWTEDGETETGTVEGATSGNNTWDHTA